MKINIRLIINKEIFWQDKNILEDEEKANWCDGNLNLPVKKFLINNLILFE